MNIKFDMNLVKTIGRGAGKYGKHIVVEGIKSIVAQGAMRTVNTVFEEGPGAIKEWKFDDWVGINEKIAKKKMFSKRKKLKEKTEETHEDEDIEYADFEEIEDDDVIDTDDTVVDINDKRAN